MEMEALLKELGITKKGEKSKNGAYIIDFDNSDEWGKYFSKLDRNKDVEELEENSMLVIHGANIMFVYKDMQINLKADYDSDSYKLVANKFDLDNYEELVNGDEDNNEDEKGEE